MAVRSYGQDTDLGHVCIVTLTLEIWHWVKIMTHPLGHGQKLCEILLRSDSAVRSYGPDTVLGYRCIVTLTLDIWPWFKIRTHPWVMEKNSEILSRCNMSVRSYGLHTNFWLDCKASPVHVLAKTVCPSVCLFEIIMARLRLELGILLFNYLMNTIKTKPWCASSSNLANMVSMMWGLTVTLLILEVKGQGHIRQKRI